jgi:hypothetical protein
MKYNSFVELFDCPALAFVARAVDKRETNRPQLKYVKIEKKGEELEALATDGKRLHKAVIDRERVRDVFPGYWRVLKNKEIKERDEGAEDDLGPSYLVYTIKNVLWLAREENPGLLMNDETIERVFPRGDPIKEGTVCASEFRSDSLNTFIKGLPELFGINPRYLWDLGPYEWHYKIFPGRTPILFEYENRTALIMPITLD